MNILHKTKFAILLFVITLLLTGCIFAAGSYCSNPAYYLYMDEVRAVRELQYLKIKHPEYYVELTGQDGKKFTPDKHVEPYYYCVGLKIPMGDTIVVVKVLVNVYDLNAKNIDVVSVNAKSENTRCELVFLAYSFENGRTWRINEDYVPKDEQKNVLKAFEKEVLDKIGVKYRRRRFI